MITLLLSLRHGARRQHLQREQLLPGARAHRNPTGDGLTDQIIEWTSCPIAGEPSVLHVALDETTPLKLAANALGDLLYQYLQLRACGCWHMTECMLIARQVHGTTMGAVPPKVTEPTGPRGCARGSRVVGKSLLGCVHGHVRFANAGCT